MFKKLLLVALLVLSFSAVLAPTSAYAETEASLKDRLLTSTELSAALTAGEAKQTFTKATDLDPIEHGTLISAGRLWEAKDGSFLAISILSYKDGRQIPGGARDEILGGDFAKDVMTGAFDTYEYAGAFGTVLDDNDISQGFYGKGFGKEYEVISVSFIRGNIFGIVYYATPGSNEGLEAWSAFGGLTAKLP